MSAPAVKEPSICTGCGILRDPTKPRCGTCGAAYPPAAVRALAQPAQGFWVAVRGAFWCRACGYQGPLNHIEEGDGVTCTKCGVEQKFDTSWKELVAFAHAVGDFGTPGHEGRFPDPAIRLTEAKPHAQVGSGAPWVEAPHGEVTLGNPLCRGCRAPVVAVPGGASFTTECSGCKERRSYERAPAKRYKLAGVVADEHEVDRREVGVTSNRGAMIITCPNCNGQLSGITQSDGACTCAFCSAQCRISTRTHAKVGHADTPRKVWWFHLAGPCAERTQIARRAKQQLEHRAKLEGKDRVRAAQVARDNAAYDAAKKKR
ncbi:MAG: hypothetical protein JNL83_20980 [Myxococcales bacterium]|nr:hypothetical protein [Myxococcales bacterium]